MRSTSSASTPGMSLSGADGRSASSSQVSRSSIASLAHGSERGGDPLMPREREVAALIARGLSNKQVAGQLVITERTVASHVEHFLDKLGFTSRNRSSVQSAWRRFEGKLR